jgi:dihydroorotate dehydrogenase electron transfer subunit
MDTGPIHTGPIHTGPIHTGAIHAGAAAFPVSERVARVLESAPVGRRYHRLLLDAPDLSARSRPGQFFHLLCRDPGGQGPYLRRPMSIWRCGQDRPLGFLFHVKGRGTAALAALRAGDGLSMVGPLGHGFAFEPGWRRIPDPRARRRPRDAWRR